VSFGTYARKARDPELPFAKRTTALRSAVVLYQPLGWHLTLRFLDQAVGGYARTEPALLRALDLLEESRRHWLAAVETYAHNRRAAKAGGCRSPLASDPNPFRHPTGWHGPLRPAASLYGLPKWLARLSPADPLESEVTAVGTACIDAGGALTQDQEARLAKIAEEMERRARSAAARGDHGRHFRAMTALRIAEMVTQAAEGEEVVE
jgi:hypothetical protein